MKKQLLVLHILLLSLSISAQSYFDKTSKEVEVGTFLSTSGQNPFWLRSNQYGTVPLEAQGIQFRARLTPPSPPTDGGEKTLSQGGMGGRSFSFNYAFEVVANVGKTNQFLIPEAFAAIKWKAFELYAGRRREIYGLVDTTLTAGSYIWSGNALPMPKVQLSIPAYTSIIGKGLISIKGGINHGWFSDNGVVKNFYLHQKWLYGRIGRPTAKLKFYGGFNHQVQWGGYSETLKQITNVQYPPTIDGFLAPYPLYSYQFVLIPFLQKFKATDPTKVPGYDSGLAIGNHLGSVDIGASYENKEIEILLYHQHPYDFARSLYTLNNLQDGNNGLSISFKEKTILQKVLIEYLNTTSQGRYRFGKLRETNDGEVDSYFSHGQYQGWYDNGKILGTPFIHIQGVDGYQQTSNRVRAFSLAAKGVLKKINYVGRYSFTKSLGTYGQLIDLKQHYLLFALSKSVKANQKLTLNLASDFGTIQNKNNVGIFVSYGWFW